MSGPVTAEPTFVIMINGGYGVGKSTVLDHVGDRLAAAGRPFSLFDVDWFHRSWPTGADDPDNVITEAANLSAVWQNYRRTGPRQAVLAGVIASAGDQQRYATAFGLTIRSVRLTASAAVTEERLRRRYSAQQQAALDWHLTRHTEIARQLEQADLDELVLRTEDRSPDQLALAIVAHFA